MLLDTSVIAEEMKETQRVLYLITSLKTFSLHKFRGQAYFQTHFVTWSYKLILNLKRLSCKKYLLNACWWIIWLKTESSHPCFYSTSPSNHGAQLAKTEHILVIKLPAKQTFAKNMYEVWAHDKSSVFPKNLLWL